MQLALGLARLAALARQDEWRAGEAQGLTPTQGDILTTLAQRAEGMRVGALAAQIHVSQATASDALAALDRKGLIERYADPTDKRATLLRLSRKGRALAKRWPDGFARVIDTLSPKDQAALMGIVVRAIAALERQGAVSRQRMCLSCQFFAENAHPGAARPHHCRLIGAALGEGDLRIDCPEHQEAHAA
ncbi:MAG: MarR family transcriptional regulator [Terricaulis sp.]|nr:MarR family transcriptional regulator [Terricaulis sp.]